MDTSAGNSSVFGGKIAYKNQAQQLRPHFNPRELGAGAAGIYRHMYRRGTIGTRAAGIYRCGTRAVGVYLRGTTVIGAAGIFHVMFLMFFHVRHSPRRLFRHSRFSTFVCFDVHVLSPACACMVSACARYLHVHACYLHVRMWCMCMHVSPTSHVMLAQPVMSC